MRHVFIIGNGFDLAHGHISSYRNFIIWYLTKKWAFIHENGIRGFEDNDGLIYLKMTGGYPQYQYKDIIEPKDFIDNLNTYYRNHSSFFKYILSDLLKSIIEKDGWADIEKLYYRLLFDIFSDEKEGVKKGSITLFPKTITGLNNSFDSLKKELKEYLKLYVMPVIHLKKSQYVLERLLSYEREINNVSDIIKEPKLIVNFNYTNTIDKYAPNVHSDEYRIYIHGNIHENEEHIIFGYGDEMHKGIKEIEDEDNNEYLVNMKSFGYSENDNYQSIIDFMDNGKFHVNLIGHSLGLSDRLLLNRIFEHENCDKIEIHYHRTKNGDNYKELLMNLSRHFNNKVLMREKVFPHNQSRPMD